MSARLAGLGLLVTVLALAAACGGEKMAAAPTAPLTPSTEPSGTTVTPRPEPSPIKPVSEDGEIWDLVVAATSGNISPILQPTALPEGLETVTIGELANKLDAHLFVVEYAGPGKRLRIGAGMFNPPPPGPGGHGEAVKLRGLECNPEVKGKGCILQVNDDANPKERVWLWWNEPGRFAVEGGGPPLDSVFYLVVAEGFDPQEVMTVAESLQPTP